MTWDFKLRWLCQLHVLDLLIRKRSIQMAAPVDEARVPVDETLLVHSTEGLDHSRVSHFVKSESKSLPIDGDAHPAELIVDLAAILVFPVPNTLNKRLSAQIMSRLLLSLPKLLLDNTLRRDSRMITSW